ncbi:MAG: DUF1156 domain-containing protein [Saccharolobus sp.]|uniref:DUF1156 domain-containing protein n=1 Tax=Saccharolobus sp. TaxID=2100761 RepID=UPI00316A2C9B
MESQGPKFIETDKFPIDRINEASAKEKNRGGMPPIWEMAFWWTRKPLIGARSIIAASILPESVDKSEFLRLVRLDSSASNVPHNSNPVQIPSLKDFFKNAKLLDPFAGFGSIPLEAIRLGVGEVVASDFLPTAYVFLKAVLEIPKWARDNNLHETLIKDVEKWGNWILDELRKDPEIQELYDDDAEGYIGSWEIRCPHCGNYTPLIGNWWLAKKVAGKGDNEETNLEEEGTKKGNFERLAWMVPKNINNKIYIDIFDLNKELSRDKINAKVNTSQGIVEAYGKKYKVQQPNIDAKRNTATCLICNNPIKGGKAFYVKDAVRDWNENLEKYLAGEITKEQLLNSKARPRIIVKVKKNIAFKKVIDQEKLWKALEMLKQIWGDPDIPIEPTPEYENHYMPIAYGVDKFFKFFNPRQLLTLVKLVKLIRQAGKRIEEEKLKVWDKDKARKYAEAIVTYLSIALAKYSDYNCVSSYWDGSLLKIDPGFATRGVKIMWNWVDNSPFSNLSGSFVKSLSSVLRGLQYLIDAISDSPTRVKVLLDDATKLNKITEDFDLIVTDPPYWDDVPYTELSDLYYIWLKRALSDVKEVAGVLMRVPKFHPEAFFDDAGNEIEIQWKRFADREISENEGRLEYFSKNVNASERFKQLLSESFKTSKKVNSFNYFKQLLSESFKTIADRLKEDGILVTYYTHTTPEAWEALLEAGWSKTGLRITKTHRFATESLQRVTARGKITLDTSLVVVWRKGFTSSEDLVNNVYLNAVNECSEKAKKFELRGLDLFISTLGCILSHFTQYKNFVGVVSKEDKESNKRDKADKKSYITILVEDYIYLATAEAILNAIGASSSESKLSSYSKFYLLSKVLIDKKNNTIRRSMDRNTLVLLSIGTRSDRNKLEKDNIVKKERDKIVLIEPSIKSNIGTDDRGEYKRNAIENVLRDKNIDPSSPNIRTPIDALHLLEYYAVTKPKESFRREYEDLQSKYDEIDEAVALAEKLYYALPANDIEREIIKDLLIALDKPPKEGIEKYLK